MVSENYPLSGMTKTLFPNIFEFTNVLKMSQTAIDIKRKQQERGAAPHEMNASMVRKPEKRSMRRENIIMKYVDVESFQIQIIFIRFVFLSILLIKEYE